jgi:hypothetical protein
MASLGVKYINAEFGSDKVLDQLYRMPKLTDVKESVHMFHRAHHATAINYVINVLTNDRNVASNSTKARKEDSAFAYFRTDGTKSDPSIATWKAPSERPNLNDLYTAIQDITNASGNIGPNVNMSLDQTYYMCRPCNLLTSPEAAFNFVLGIRPSGSRNENAVLIPRDVITIFRADTNDETNAENAYGNWNKHAKILKKMPTQDGNDDLAPAVAYYLHMCLPQGFKEFDVPDQNKRGALVTYVELSWILLNIAAVLTHLDQFQAVTGQDKINYGHQHHRGVIDLYVSYFLWRLFYLAHWEYLNEHQIDFVVFHTMFFTQAANCKGLYSESSGYVIGQRVCRNTKVAAPKLIESILAGLLRQQTKLKPMFEFIKGVKVNRNIQQYFISRNHLTEFVIGWMKQSVVDFESAVRTFGISALLFRCMQLCDGYPQQILDLMLDFHDTLKSKEIVTMKKRMNLPTIEDAMRVYASAATDGISEKELRNKKKSVASKSSPWASVVFLNKNGAFARPI